MKKSKSGAQAMPPQFSGDLVAWAMWLYYVEGETQEGTARKLGMSRASVVNYLQEARERGLVKISVDPEILAQGQLSARLKARFGIKDAFILPKVEHGDETPEQLRKRAGIAGARLLRNLLEPGDTLGVAWGRTMYDLAQAMERAAVPDTTVLQVSGSMLDERLSSPEFITSLIANRISGRSLNFHAPAVLSSKALRDSLMKEPPIARFVEKLRHCKITVFGIGAMDEAPYLGDVNLADTETIAAYRARGAVGIIVGRFIDATGLEIQGPLTDRQIAISLDDLKAAPKRLMVATGPSKTEAVKAALTGGLATHLVLDHTMALSLVGDGAGEGV
ncbi:sugar-binding transcriptional regulator [Actibacterium sp. 188UL27-1]|uniref:sugar-binding transcriptional regulator n=1 Tax=Actibacterium sp. 188UL27-1 TaxID=2786961 RepID=UPI001958A7F3|nr:sugar-binding transcriptional regulator [Actibacterium sp. 188UL27-1]MBM7068688.1 sugar-binding transcriptional regulator [Actibacterium sp. 188UL27-1]